VSLELPSDREDELTAALWSLEPLGIEIGLSEDRSCLEVWFAEPMWSAQTVPTELDRILAPFGAALVRREVREEAEQDWLATWREAARPIEVGSRWLLDPREPGAEAPEAGGRELLRVPARRAFGTGSHESTRLILAWLEDLDLIGRRVLDLGSGSAILSMAAEGLGAASVVGVDIDPVACFVASDNRLLHDSNVSLVAGELAALRHGSFDLALVNILPGQWVSAALQLAEVLRPSATVLFSGVPVADRAEFEADLADAEMLCHEERIEGEWAALRAVRAA
jgi:ribosomal protein L11 methyltransferase